MARPADDTRRTRLLTVLCACALALGPATQAASAQDTGAPTTGQLASGSGGQIAAATATATQQAPQNIAIPVQILSPGDSGPITQVNTAGANAAATDTQAQAPAAPQPPAPSQPPSPPPASPASDATQQAPAPAPAAGTPPAPDAAAVTSDAQQSATATAQATQTAPVNVYIPVSVLSPGDHGPVTQINSVSAQATATNTAQTGAATAAPTAQAAGSGAAAAQQAPANVSTPVTIGGTDVGEHPASTPWVWTWVWQLDCSAGAAAPDAGMLAPIISQVTGGAWEWHWTWTCAPASAAPPDAPGAGDAQDQAPGATPQSTPAPPAGTLPAAATPGAVPTAPSAASGVAPTSTGGRHEPTRGSGILGFSALQSLGGVDGLLAIPADITPSAVISPDTSAHSAPVRTGGTAPVPAVPDPRPTPPAPPVLAAGASGGAGGAPLSIGLAALIGAFLLSVPRFGTRARTQVVHRSAQAVPGPKDRPG